MQVWRQKADKAERAEEKMPDSRTIGTKPRIALLLGDPSGIGPEITVKLLAEPETRRAAEILLIADPRALAAGMAATGLTVPLEGPDAPVLLPHAGPEPWIAQGRATAEGGRYALETLALGVAAVREGRADALCFAPLNKSALHEAGMRHQDELHWFAERLGHTGPTSELNVLDRLWTSRVTSHVPLMAVSGLLSRDAICESIALLHHALAAAGIAAPRIAVCGLNPHNGDNGNYGREEIDVIAPAVAEAQCRGLPAVGPFPPDTVFVRAKRGEFDAVVTMYHDQGQIAMKLIGFERGVTIQGGLPIPVTTAAHGTAYDIVGRGSADHSAMRNAFRMACRMAAAKAR
jgi:4-hydroxythreonine-4-phosphate dehydrogenase